jgi:hypothetical protein
VAIALTGAGRTDNEFANRLTTSAAGIIEPDYLELAALGQPVDSMYLAAG